MTSEVMDRYRYAGAQWNLKRAIIIAFTVYGDVYG